MAAMAHGLALACSEVSFRRLNGEEHLTSALGMNQNLSCENEDLFRKIYIYKLIEIFHEKFWIESSKTGGEEWLFKYQYSKSYQQEMWLCWKSNGHQQLWNDGFGYMVQMTPQKKKISSQNGSWRNQTPDIDV